MHRKCLLLINKRINTTFFQVNRQHCLYSFLSVACFWCRSTVISFHIHTCVVVWMLNSEISHEIVTVAFSTHLLSLNNSSYVVRPSPPQQRWMGRSSQPGLSNGREAQGWEPPIGSPHDRSRADWSVLGHIGEEAHNKTSSANRKHTLCVFCQLLRAVNPPTLNIWHKTSLPVSVSHSHHQFTHLWISSKCTYTLTELWKTKHTFS